MKNTKVKKRLKRIQIRKYAPEDFDYLLKFLEEIDGDFYPPLSKRRELIQYLREDLINPNVTLVVEYDRNIIGVANLQLDCPSFGECYINTLGISAEHRRQGLGSRLMTDILNEAVILKYKKIKVRTWSTNKAGINLYTKFDFCIDHIIKNDRSHGVDSIYFWKKP